MCTATSWLDTGTPRLTLTRITASNGMTSLPELRTLFNSCSTLSALHTYSTAAWVAMVVTPARVITECCLVGPGSMPMTA